MINARLIKLLAKSKKYIFYNVLCQWLCLMTQITIVFTIAKLAEKLLYSSLKSEDFFRGAIILFFSAVFRFICDIMTEKTSYLACAEVKKSLREKIYEKLLSLGSSYKEYTLTSELVQISTEGVDQLEAYFGKYLPQLFYSLLAPITLFLVLSPISLKASLILLIFVPLIPISIILVQKIAKRLLNKYWDIYTGLGNSFLENLQGLTALKIYGADEKKSEEMDKEAQLFRKITMKVLSMQLNAISVMDIVAYGGAAIGMIIALNQFLKGDIAFNGCLKIVLLAVEFFIPLRLLGSFFHISMNGMAASDKIFRLFDIEPAVDGEMKIKNEKFKIILENVSFAYDEERQILDNININLPEKALISLVGESGCGKSTIAKIISARQRKYLGEIKIDDIELKDIEEKSLMKSIVLIQHNSYLFKGTVEENLKMGKANATREEMLEALEKVNMLSFLESKNGLKTQIMENGSNFSGGQCQRIALARALLADASVYIFDEATSNIDAQSEEDIIKVIYELRKTKTVLLISHRLSNVVEADYIYMIKNGRIEESGTHNDLMKKKGAYSQLFNKQKELEEYCLQNGKEQIIRTVKNKNFEKKVVM